MKIFIAALMSQATLYLSVSFVLWEFDWVTKISELSFEERAFVLLCALVSPVLWRPTSSGRTDD